jgi:membrane protease YdiL (CAAX protease family)
MAGDAVIAADLADTAVPGTPSLPEHLALALLVAWSLVAAVIAVRKGWLQGSGSVRWRLGLYEDQILIACGVLLSGLVASVVASLLGATAGTTPAPGISLAAILASSGVTLGAWWLLRSNALGVQNRPVDAPATCSNTRAIGAGLMGLLLAWPVVALTTRLGEWIQIRAGGPAVPEVAHQTLEQLREHAHEPLAWLLALAVTLLTPLTEEVLWRGAVQQAFKSAGLPRTLAMIGASALFALVHWNAVPAEARAGALPALFLLGLLFGWLFERSGSLLAPFAAHAAFNAANLILFSTLPG